MSQKKSHHILVVLCLLAAGVSQAATLVVDHDGDPGTADDNLCSLREAISAINSGMEDVDDCLNTSVNGFGTSDEIQFDAALSGGEIDLNGTELPQITVGVAITGPVPLGPDGITIDGENNSRIFNLDSSVPVSLSNLTLRRGRTTADNDGGGALRSQNLPLLALSDVVIKNSSTEGMQSSGGAVFVVDGNLNLLRITLSDNQTTGAGANGGALFLVGGDLDLKQSSILGNTTEGLGSDGGGLYVRVGITQLADCELRDNSTSGDQATGGAMSMLEATVSLGECEVANNHTEGEDASGGGLYARDGTLVLLPNTVVSGNQTQGEDALGGGLAVQGGPLQINNSEIMANSTAGLSALGGGLYGDDPTVISNSRLSGNSTSGDNAAGGGAYLRGEAALFDSIISNNTTSGVESPGGGLRLQINADDALLSRLTITGNSTTGFASLGGGLSLTNGDATVLNSTISDNLTRGNMSWGGGVANSFGEFQFVNSTVSGNSTRGNDAHGGGLYAENLVDIILTHSTIADNEARKTDSDGLFVEAADTLTLNNSLVVQPGSGDVACNGPADTAVNSLATDVSCGTGVDSAANIELQPLAFNGGSTQTHALGDNSVAIGGAPVDALCLDAPPAGADGRDQRGLGRPLPSAGLCDIGAFEAGAFFDLGDAPTAVQSGFAGSYPTLLADNGAAHGIAGNPLSLGGMDKDTEADGQPADDAQGDDNNGVDDEDGVFFTSPIEAGSNATVDVTVSGSDGFLNAWIDFNADGDWDDAGEQILSTVLVMVGSNAGLTFAVPADAMAGESFARFRLSHSNTPLAPQGLDDTGEVEDYEVFIGPEPTVMFNDAVMNPSIRENKGTFVVEDAVLLSNPSSQQITVDIMFDAGASDAMLPDDFDFMPATVTFAPGETSADLEVMIVDDGVDEPEESAFFDLANPVGASLVSPATFQATLKDPNKDGGGGGGGSCSLGNGNGRFDPLLSLLALLSTCYICRRRFRHTGGNTHG